jgi:hypothetical protein
MKKIYQLFLLLTICQSQVLGQTTQQLLDSAAIFPPMPTNVFEVALLNGNLQNLTFASGTPFNDLSYTLFDTDFMEGETAGYDVFCQVDPADAFPGSDRVKILECVSSLSTNSVYGAAQGDRIILGAADHPQPFFQRGTDGKDNDYLVIRHFDFVNGHIQLKGEKSDYHLLFADIPDGVKTKGWYLFYVKNGAIDLISFIFPCDEVTDTPPNGITLCNANKQLSLDDLAQFRFAQNLPTIPVFADGIAQIGSAGKEIVNGITVDKYGYAYVFGNSDGNLDGNADPDNEMFVAKIHPETGAQVWTTEIGNLNGALFFDAVADDQFLYASGRTFGALPGFQNNGAWDAIIVKMRLDDGLIVATQQWGESGIDAFGNIILDDSGHLFCSGAGSPPGAQVSYGTGDSAYVVAKFRADNLEKVWVVTEPVLTNATKVAEAWGGITYVPGSLPGNGRLVVGGWFISPTTPPKGAEGFVKIYENLNGALPTTAVVKQVGAQGFKADWVWDNAADDEGNIYVVGATTGNLQGQHQGESDAYIIKYDKNLENPVIRQFGTNKSDLFSRLEFDPVSKNLFAIGYTYGNFSSGNFSGQNADPSGLSGDIIIQKLDKNLTPLKAFQFGTKGEERGFAAVKDSFLYLGGMTEGTMTGTSYGSFDAFAMAFRTSDLSVVQPVLTSASTAIFAKNEVKVYPNPTQSTLFFDSESDGDFHLYDAFGRLRLEGIVYAGTQEIDVTVLPVGMYFLEISDNKSRVVLKISKI